MITGQRLYPALPAHEQIKKPFQWPKRHLDENIKWNTSRSKGGGRPPKGATTIREKILVDLENHQWKTCLDLAENLGCRRKSVQEQVKILYEGWKLKRRRKTPHEYEYTLRETTEVNHDEN